MNYTLTYYQNTALGPCRLQKRTQLINAPSRRQAKHDLREFFNPKKIIITNVRRT